MADIPAERVRDRISERFFHGIGVDPASVADQNHIRELIRWADEERELRHKREAEIAQEKRDRRSRNWLFVYGAASTVFGLVATYLIHKITG